MFSGVELEQKLSVWRPYIEGRVEIIEDELITADIAYKALEELAALSESSDKHFANISFSRKIVCKTWDLLETLDRLIRCIVSDWKMYHSKVYQKVEADRIFSILQKFELNICYQSLAVIAMDLSPAYLISRLTLLPPTKSAFDALLGAKGLLSKSIFSMMLKVFSEDVIYRCFINSKLKTVKDLIELFKINHHETNVILILKRHLDESREQAKNFMGNRVNEFEKQWSDSPPTHWVYFKRINQIPSSLPEKIEAWDFVKQTIIEKELNDLQKEPNPLLAQILIKTVLYKGEKGDFYLRIFNSNLFSGEEFFGAANYKQLKQDDNFFWSPDGRSFYTLGEAEVDTLSNQYTLTFEAKEGAVEKLEMIVNEVYANAAIPDSSLKARYERQGIASIKELLKSFQANKAIFIPFISAYKPEFLYESQEGSVYIYMESKSENEVRIFYGSKNNFKNPPIKHVKRDEDAISILLGDGSVIFIPKPNDKSLKPHYVNTKGTYFALQNLNVNAFDLTSIGIYPEPLNERRTFLDVYKN